MGRSHPRPTPGDSSSPVWEIGLVPVPCFVTEGYSEPIRPVLALVMEAGGPIRASAVGHPDRPLEALEPALAQAINQPQAPCAPRQPQKVVVNSALLLKLLPPLLPGAQVTQGPTPGLDQALDSLREQMAGEESKRGLAGLTTYLTKDVTPEVVASFFEAAAELHDLCPWERIPGKDGMFWMSCGALGIEEWVGWVVGLNEENKGIIVFNCIEDAKLHELVIARVEGGDKGALRGCPPHRVLNFDPRANVPEPLLRELDQHHWRVANPDAIPTLLLPQSDLLLAPPCREDLQKMEVVIRALCRWLDAEPDLISKWEEGTAYRRRFRVTVGGRNAQVTIGMVEEPKPLRYVEPSPRLYKIPTEPAPLSLKVPAALRDRVDGLMAVIEPFCAARLDGEYRELIHGAVAALARKRPSPLLTGQEASWCAGVVHAIGSANFLFDATQTPHCTPKQIYDYFNVAASTALAHSKKVRERLSISPYSPEWIRPSMLDDSPLVWMLEVNGFTQDIRLLPLQIQVEACSRGLIPYVPALRDQVRAKAKEEEDNGKEGDNGKGVAG